MLLKRKVNFEDLDIERRRYNNGGTDVLMFILWLLIIGLIGVGVYVLLGIKI